MNHNAASRRRSPAHTRQPREAKLSTAQKLYQNLLAAIGRKLGDAAKAVSVQLNEQGKRISIAVDNAMENAAEVLTAIQHAVDHLLKRFNSARYDLSTNVISLA